MNETTEHYDNVREFMRLAGQDTPNSPTEINTETRELRARLLLEEVLETIQRGLGVSVYVWDMLGDLDIKNLLFQAEGRDYNPTELLDGCCDVNVVTTGTLIAAGLTDAKPQRLVDDNNLAKFGPGGYRREDGKWIKPPDHQPPALSEEIERQTQVALKWARDDDGTFWSPAIPWGCMPEDKHMAAYLRVLGYEIDFIEMDGDAPEDVINQYEDGDNEALAKWEPSRPDGKGWFLGAVYDTEDEPKALWLKCTEETRQTVIDATASTVLTKYNPDMSDNAPLETHVFKVKRAHLLEKGMEPIGWVFRDPSTGQRATLDYLGRVQWWGVDNSGNMFGEETKS